MLISTKTTPSSQKFSGKRLPHQSFEEFQKFAHESDFLAHFSDAFHPDNFVDNGRVNNVYRIPNNDVFLLRVPLGIPVGQLLKQPLTLSKVQDSFPINNLGQAVVKIGKNVSGIIKQSGIVLGLQNWHSLRMGGSLSQDDLTEFINKLKITSGLGQKSYDCFADELKLIREKGFDFDYNPRNILLDEQKQQINIIDVGKHNFLSRLFMFPPSSNLILHSLLGGSFCLKAYSLADSAQKAEVRNLAKIIKEKSKVIFEKSDLPKNELRCQIRYLGLGVKYSQNEIKEYNKFRKFVASL